MRTVVIGDRTVGEIIIVVIAGDGEVGININPITRDTSVHEDIVFVNGIGVAIAAGADVASAGDIN